MSTTSRLQVATDGSCYPNPGPGGWAWVADDGRYEAGSFSDGTNNVGELMAIKMALLAHVDRPIEILYDSQYAANSVTLWGPKWRDKGQTNKANYELIIEIVDIIAARPLHADILWTHVKGHDPNNTYPLNTTVDKIANSMIVKSDGHHESGVTEILTEVPKGRKSTRRKPRPIAISSKAVEPHQDEIRCSHRSCQASIKNHAWGKIKSSDTGWFHQKNGASWCPDHIPAWVASWRASKTTKES